MKFFLLYCLQIFAILELSGQSMNLASNFTDSGRNVTIQYEWRKGNSEFSFGLGYNINKLAHNDDQNNVYRKRLFATEAIHHLNVDLTYQRYILKNKVKCIEPFLFYDLQAKYAPTRNRMIWAYDYDPSLVEDRPEEGILYREYITTYGPFYWLENNIGIGLKANLGENIYLKQRFGVGMDFILGHDDVLASKIFTWFEWEFSTLMHFSVGVNF